MNSSIFVKIPDANGNVSAKGYENWIEALSLEQGASLAVQTHPGSSEDRVQSFPEIGEFHLTLVGDRSKVHLFNLFYKQKVIPKVDIHVCTTGTNLSPYLKYELENVIVSKRAFAVDHFSARPILSISLNPTKMSENYLGMDSAGRTQAPVRASYDIQTLS